MATTTIEKPQHRLMTDKEQATILVKAVTLRRQGKTEEASALIKSVPLLPHMAKIGKEVYGANFLIEHGYNLLEADAEFGDGWLYR